MSINVFLAAIMLINLMLVATSRVARAIRLAAVQGAILGLVLLLMHDHWPFHVVLMALSTAAIKGVVIPVMLSRARSRVKGGNPPDPHVGYTASLVLAACGTGMAFMVARKLPLQAEALGTLFVPASLTALFTGFLLLTARRRALLQVVGYLVIENGVYLFSLLLVKSMPLLVETGVLLDLVVGIFVMGIVINHIQAAFDSQDTFRLAHLKD
jgi:hydrogenase-4 component E